MTSERPRAAIPGGCGLALLFASGVGFWVLVSVISNNYSSGHGVLIALLLAWLGGLLLLLVSWFTRDQRRALAILLLAGAAMLGLAIGLIALDSATYVGLTGGLGPGCIDCIGNPFPSPTYHHVGFLYVLWGIPLAWLLVQGIRLLRAQDDRVPVGDAGEGEAADTLMSDLRRELIRLGVSVGSDDQVRFEFRPLPGGGSRPVLRSESGREWSGPLGQAAKRLASLPDQAGPDEFWLALWRDV